MRQGIVTDPYELTPVQEIDGLYVKRDDLFAPFGAGSVNGGKLRQCWMLVNRIKDEYKSTISCCSIHSPQAPISAAVSKHFGLPCHIYYGGTKEERLNELSMPKIVRKFEGQIEIYPSGRHSILYAKARQNAEKDNSFIISYGFNLKDYPELIFGAVADQVENIPHDLDNLVVTCGSGITTTGIIHGLSKFKKKIKHLYLVATAPSREKMIKDALEETALDVDYTIVDLFHRKGFVYEDGEEAYLEGIELHPNYEAKAYKWLTEESGINLHDYRTLFWIVGSKPYEH